MSEQTEESIRAELAAIKEQSDALDERSNQLRELLKGPRVEPMLCYWRHHTYYEDNDSLTASLEDAFGMLEAMEEYGSASTVGVRIGGHLVTWLEYSGEPRLPWDDDDKIRRDSDMRHREMVAD